MKPHAADKQPTSGSGVTAPPKAGYNCRMLLMIDNYDSFTFNLVQYLGELGARVDVRRNDQITVEEIEAALPEAIIISPGPCTPDEAGISVELVRRLGAHVPMLGVCLGHQSIGQAYGGRVVRARRIMHGKVATIRHFGQGIFQSLAQPFPATRYHSLVVDAESLPECLQVTALSAESEDPDEIMALCHVAHPVSGVQFHPESIKTPCGHDLLQNFLDSAADWHRRRRIRQ